MAYDFFLISGRKKTLAMASVKAETLCEAHGWLVKYRRPRRINLVTTARCDGTPVSSTSPAVIVQCRTS